LDGRLSNREEERAVSLYAAEEHARTDREEVLLSRLFGTLSMLDRESYLDPLMKGAGIEIAPGEYASLQIQFWPELGPSGPDVVLESDSLLVFVAACDRERIDRDEMIGLARSGRKLSPRFHLLVLTDGTLPPPEIDEVNSAFRPQREPPCRWLGWPAVYGAFHRRLREGGEKQPVRELVQNLLGLLAAEGRAPFVGFDPFVLRGYREALPAIDRMHASVRLLVAELDGQLQNEGIRRISIEGHGLPDLPSAAARVLDLDYADETWDAGVVTSGALFLQVDYSGGEVEVGFRCRAAKPAAKALLVEGRSRIAELLSAREDVLIRVSGAERPGEPSREASKLALLETQNGGGRIERVELFSVHDGTLEDLVPSLIKDLIGYRDLALSLPLLPLPRVNGESPFVVAGQ
jgi:hypothetical protein